ncbi:hypothetical protein [Marinitoga lauensis]|uniref:hypothetical protein n=1 Tax=Marinitoga lauensis TaxID=2201189 RepID=UPI001404877E|nr:hypothetical protein [Marinitoga lauensis]
MKDKYGRLFDEFLKYLKDSEYLMIIDDRIMMNKKGLDFSNLVFEEILDIKDKMR